MCASGHLLVHHMLAHVLGRSASILPVQGEGFRLLFLSPLLVGLLSLDLTCSNPGIPTS